MSLIPNLILITYGSKEKKSKKKIIKNKDRIAEHQDLILGISAIPQQALANVRYDVNDPVVETNSHAARLNTCHDWRRNTVQDLILKPVSSYGQSTE